MPLKLSSNAKGGLLFWGALAALNAFDSWLWDSPFWLLPAAFAILIAMVSVLEWIGRRTGRGCARGSPAS